MCTGSAIDCISDSRLISGKKSVHIAGHKTALYYECIDGGSHMEIMNSVLYSINWICAAGFEIFE
jgi:hypothetical protein